MINNTEKVTSNHCPICQSDSAKVIGLPEYDSISLKLKRKEYSIVECTECRFYYVLPSIDFSEEEWQQLYGSEYFTELTSWHKKKRIIDVRNRLNKLKQYCNNDTEYFLDIGCGKGLALSEAFSRGWNTHGMDIYDNRKDDAKVSGITFHRTKLTDSNFSSEQFDMIYMDSVLEHITNPLEYLGEIYRILKKGGVLYIGVPNEDSLFNSIRKTIFTLIGKSSISPKLKPFKSPYHIGGFNKNSIRIISEKANLEILLLRNFSSRFEFMKSTPLRFDFWVMLFFFPINLIAILLDKEIYYEAYLKKN